MKIELVKADITELKTQAIVNAANRSLLGGGGVDGAIHRKGGKAILDACVKIRNSQGECKDGEAVITTAGNLPSEFVIHTVGPIWNDGKNKEFEKLKNCYLNSLKLAEENKVLSISFPNISTGVFRFPKDLAAKIAVETVNKYKLEQCESTIDRIVFVCFDQENYDLYHALLN